MSDTEAATDELASTVYDGAYARTYGQRWWHQDHWRADELWYHGLISDRLGPGVRWLDVGCGTGHFLSKFPEATRAGLDLSGDMLAVAREANPGVPFRQASATEPYPEWNEQWDLVTSTGEPWSYLRTLDEFELWVANMAAWTSPHGVVLNQTPDIRDLAFATIDYHFGDDPPPPGVVSVLGVMWDMAEHDIVHGQMIWPSIDLWARWYGRHFRRVEILHPPVGSGVIFGRTIFASEKRAPGDDRPTEYIYEPPPVDPVPSGTEVIEKVRQDLANQLQWTRDELATVRRQVSDLVDLLARPQAADAGDPDRYDIVGVVHEQVAGIRRELAELARRLGDSPPPRRLTVRRVASGVRRRLRR
jgi:SAM-dependent methyltransferase